MSTAIHEIETQNSINTLSIEETLRLLQERGLTFTQCINAFAASEDDPYVQKAREFTIRDDLNVDSTTVIAQASDGAWVQSWLWISNEEAGIYSYSELLERVLDSARRLLDGEHRLDEETCKLRLIQSDWLEELISNFADKLDGIENEIINNSPGAITWVDLGGQLHRFMPSDALYQLLALARLGGLSTDKTNRADAFCRQYSNKLDAILTNIHTA